MKGLTAGAVAVLLAAPVGAGDPPKTLKVFVAAAVVEARKEVDKETKEQLKAKAEAAKKARKDLEKEIKEQHGKDREKWPPEKEEALLTAEDAAAVAAADYEYIKVDPKALDDSTKNVRDSIEGKGVVGKRDHIVQVQSAEAADLVVTIVGRRSEKTLPTQLRADQYYVCFTIAPGGRMDRERFLKVPRNWRFRKFGYAAWRLQSPTPEVPLWKFEAYGEQRWANAAHNTSAMIDKFVEDNEAVLVASGT